MELLDSKACRPIKLEMLGSAYRRMVDKRAGWIVDFFGQSACGGNWIHKTTTDLRASKYERIFRKPYENQSRYL